VTHSRANRLKAETEQGRTDATLWLGHNYSAKDAMKEKSALDRQRDAAFSLTLKNRGQDHASQIIAMFPIAGQLYAFKEHSIFLIQTPDDIDPAREHPETKGATTQLYNIGTSHAVVARTIIQAKRLLDAVILESNLSPDAILDKYFLFFKELAICNSIYESLIETFLNKLKDVELALQDSQNTQFVGDIPQIPDLEDQIRSFFLTGRKALKELSTLTDLFFPAKPPSQNFEQLSAWFAHHLGQNNELYQMIRSDLEWLIVVWEIRNAIEHRDNPENNFEVRNIEIAPNCKFYAPRWRYAFPKKHQNEFVDLSSDIETYMNNIVALGEELFVLCVRETWKKGFPFSIFRVPAEKLDPKCPVQYRVTIDPKKLQRPR
jgi:hypothetical protein